METSHHFDQHSGKRRDTFMKIAAAGIFVFGIFLFARDADAAVANWQKGATIFARWNTDFSSASFQQSVRNLAATHANYVTLHIPLHQSNIYSTDVHIGGDAPTDQSLTDGINYIHSQGMGVALKFQDLPDDGNWSAYVNPGDRTAWFTNFGNSLAHFAQIAQSTGAEELVIGEELLDMSEDNINPTNTSNWIALINRIRGVFAGKLTYSANWGGDDFTNEKAHINFWSALDQIGISAYFNLYGDNSVGNLKNQWNNWNMSDITPLAQKWGKPVIFTELGYKSISTANQHPWMWWEGGSADQNAQANDYEALFSYWDQYPFMQGIYLWQWSSDPNAGWPGNNDYTPQNKTAQNTMTTWFSKTGAPPPPPPPPPPPSPTPPPPPPPPGGGNPGGTFSVNATTNPMNPAPGQATAFTVSITDTGQAASGDLVDVEIYNASGVKLFQIYFGNQAFAAGGTQTYTANWTPAAAGTYTLKVGVFKNDWSQNYYWGDTVLVFTVGGSSPPPPPPPPPPSGSTIDLWWPTDGSTISGLQPFKAVVPNTALSAYTMYWQVDGDLLNLMPDNNTGSPPHKESLVDVSGWNWKGAGPYALTFTAKDTSGAVIAQRSVKINVSH